jgi:hypothetical protein
LSTAGQLLKNGEKPGGTHLQSINMEDVAEGTYILVLFDKANKRVIKRKVVVTR